MKSLCSENNTTMCAVSRIKGEYNGFWKCCANTGVSMRHRSPTPTDQRTGLLPFQWKTALVPGLRLRTSSEQKRHRRRPRQAEKLVSGTWTDVLIVSWTNTTARFKLSEGAQRTTLTAPSCCCCHSLRSSDRCTIEGHQRRFAMRLESDDTSSMRGCR
jgi:hypothetical protein